MYCIARTVFKNSLSQNSFNQTVFSLSLSVLQNRLNVDAMIMLSQEPNAIRTYSAQNPIFFLG